MRKIVIIKESPFFLTRNVEGSKNIFFKVLNSHPIAKFSGVVDFCPSRCKVMTMILPILIRSSKSALYSWGIHDVVMGISGTMVDKFLRCFGEDLRRVKFCLRQFPCHPRGMAVIVNTLGSLLHNKQCF